MPCRTAVAETPGPVQAVSRNALDPDPGEHPSPAPRPGRTLRLSCKSPARGTVPVTAVARLGLRMSPRVPRGHGGRAAEAIPQEERSP